MIGVKPLLRLVVRCLTLFLCLSCSAELTDDELPPVSGGDGYGRNYRDTVRMRSGDVVRITVREDKDVGFSGEISAAGLISMPYLGDVRLGGLTTVEAEKWLTTALEANFYENATVSVMIERHAPRHVYVHGAVARPARVQFSAADELTVVQAVTDSGGVMAWGVPEKAYVSRRLPGSNERKKYYVNLAQAFERIDGPDNMVLQHNDWVFVPSNGAVSVVKRTAAPIHIVGAVRIPGRRKLPDMGNWTVMQAITEAGGLTNWAASEKAHIIRIDPQSGERQKIDIDIAKAIKTPESEANVVLRPGDMLHVPTAGTGDAVLSVEALRIIVNGEVKDPGIVSFEPGEKRTFVRAIFKAGGFTDYAKKDAVQLIRYDQNGVRNVTVVDAAKIMEEGYLQDDFELQANDMIIIRPRTLIWK